jgi:hypothetical protein
MIYKFPFAERLSLKVECYLGTMDSLKSIRKQLLEDYCFPEFHLSHDRVNFSIVLSFPEGYSPVKKEWVIEVMGYYKSAGILIEVRYL